MNRFSEKRSNISKGLYTRSPSQLYPLYHILSSSLSKSFTLTSKTVSSSLWVYPQSVAYSGFSVVFWAWDVLVTVCNIFL